MNEHESQAAPTPPGGNAARKRRVGLAVGHFDVLLPGMIAELRKARAVVDSIVVAVVAEEGRPATSSRFRLDERGRLEQVRALAFVDEVFLTASTLDELLDELRPALVIVDDNLARAAESGAASMLATLGVPLVVVDPSGDPARIESDRTLLGERVSDYLADCRRRWTASDLADAVESLTSLRAVVLGDVIVDEYAYCRVSGTVTKYPALAAIYQGSTVMTGGGAAIGRHVAQLAGSTRFIGTVGDRDECGVLVQSALDDAGVDATLVPWPGTWTVTKRRFITGGYPNPLAPRLSRAAPPSTRLFELNYLPEAPLPPNIEDAVQRALAESLDAADVVIVADFGHGLVTDAITETIRRHAPWWAVNAQTNSSNYGFNRITRHRGADFVCIDELEARLPSGDRRSDLATIVARLFETSAGRSVMVTRGREGLILFVEGRTYDAPALTTAVVDTVGAGDAVLSCAALCRAAALDPDVAVFLASCAGALATGVIGNERPVVRAALLEYAEEAIR